MKLFHREIQVRRATQRFLQKSAKPDIKRIARLSGEIFELQRAIFTQSGVVAMARIK